MMRRTGNGVIFYTNLHLGSVFANLNERNSSKNQQ